MVEDKEPPLVVCSADVEVWAVSPLRHAQVTWPATTFTDNDKLIATDETHTPGQFNAGRYTYTATATDASGNVGSCTFLFTVLVDTTPPTIEGCPVSMQVNTDANKNYAVVTWEEPVFTDDRELTSSYLIPVEFTSGADFPLGTTALTYVAKDAYNNQQSRPSHCASLSIDL